MSGCFALQRAACSTRKSHDIISQVAEENLRSWNLTVEGDAGSKDLFLNQHHWLLNAPLKCKAKAARKKQLCRMRPPLLTSVSGHETRVVQDDHSRHAGCPS